MHTNRSLKDICALFLCGLICTSLSMFSMLTHAATTETLVFVRHGEKPIDVDNGQLTCQGLNRSIALAPVLLSRFGTPDYLFAAAPEEKHDNAGKNYWYLRALGTIEPTAVAAGRTVDLSHGKNDIDNLEQELMSAPYQNARVFVAWEHNELDQLVQNIVHDNGGDSSIVPAWPDTDYDSIFVVSLVRQGSSAVPTFTQDHEGLDNQNSACPTAQAQSRPIFLLPSQVRRKSPAVSALPMHLH